MTAREILARELFGADAKIPFEDELNDVWRFLSVDDRARYLRMADAAREHIRERLRRGLEI